MSSPPSRDKIPLIQLISCKTVLILKLFQSTPPPKTFPQHPQCHPQFSVHWKSSCWQMGVLSIYSVFQVLCFGYLLAQLYCKWTSHSLVCSSKIWPKQSIPSNFGQIGKGWLRLLLFLLCFDWLWKGSPKQAFLTFWRLREPRRYCTVHVEAIVSTQCCAITGCHLYLFTLIYHPDMKKMLCKHSFQTLIRKMILKPKGAYTDFHNS